MNKEFNEEEMRCGLLELAYQGMLSKKYGMSPDEALPYENIVPTDWLFSYSNQEKIPMLEEAIKENILLSETKIYQKKQEGKLKGSR